MYEIPTTVHAAAKLMDEIQPGWADKIYLETFDINNPSLCVIGQVLNNGDETKYSTKLDELFGRGRSSVAVFANKQSEWIGAILLRKSGKGSWTWACNMLAEGKKVHRTSWDKNTYWSLDDLVVYFHSPGETGKAPLHVKNFSATDWEIYDDKTRLKDVKEGQKFRFTQDIKNCHLDTYQKANNGFVKIKNNKGSCLSIVTVYFKDTDEVTLVE